MAAEMEVSMWGSLISSTSSWSCSAAARRREVRLRRILTKILRYSMGDLLQTFIDNLHFPPSSVLNSHLY